ncbi:MAG: pyrroline-5-carboxylate reductase [Candidatus Omnitrophica bacterium]|nr:pyrroline-5-carboxylate reductase [Candidatus Omnitrophota bacterium]
MKKIKGTIGILGCGNMGGAVAAGLTKRGVASRRSILFFDKDRKKTSRIKKELGIRSTSSIAELLRKCGIVLLAVKPQHLGDVTAELAEGLKRKHLLISLLAGVSIGNLRRRLGKACRVVRVMPNLGLLAGKGITAVTGGNSKDRKLADLVFSSCGRTVSLAEKHFNLVTVLSGSGPAYFFYLMELLDKFGVKKGLSLNIARLLSSETALGAAELVLRSGEDPEALRRRVTSKGGTTEAAFSVLGAKSFRVLFNRALERALKRAKDLGGK